MAQIKVIHDTHGETLTVYWDDPGREEVCEEVGQGIILIKDAQGEVIGFERLYFKPKDALQELGGSSRPLRPDRCSRPFLLDAGELRTAWSSCRSAVSKPSAHQP